MAFDSQTMHLTSCRVIIMLT